MPVMDKQKLLAFAKKKAAPPPAAQALAQKKAQGSAPAPAAPAGHAPPGAAPHAGAVPPHPGAAPGGPAAPGDQQVHLHELVEEAAQEAEAGHDVDLEDVIAGTHEATADQAPPWAEDPAKWKEAAEAVGLGVPGTEDKYDEPVVVAAYLYKKIGGPVKGLTELQPPPEAPDEPKHADMSKPGAAASAIHAKATAAKAAAGPPAAGAKPAPKAPPTGPAGAAPVHGAPPAAGAKPPAGQPGADGGGDLKAMLDQAAQQAVSSPDPAITQALQAEAPQEGQPPSWAADHDKWTQAEAAVKQHWADYPDPWVVVAHVYKNMGGQVGAPGGAAPAAAPPAQHAGPPPQMGMKGPGR